MMLILLDVGLFIIVTGLALFLTRKEMVTEEMDKLLDKDAEFLQTTDSISDEGAVFIIEDSSAAKDNSNKFCAKPDKNFS